MVFPWLGFCVHLLRTAGMWGELSVPWGGTTVPSRTNDTDCGAGCGCGWAECFCTGEVPLGGSLDRRNVNCFRGTYGVYSFRVISVSVEFDAVFCALFVGAVRGLVWLVVCFLYAPARVRYVLTRFRA